MVSYKRINDQADACEHKGPAVEDEVQKAHGKDFFSVPIYLPRNENPCMELDLIHVSVDFRCPPLRRADAHGFVSPGNVLYDIAVFIQLPSRSVRFDKDHVLINVEVIKNDTRGLKERMKSPSLLKTSIS